MADIQIKTSNLLPPRSGIDIYGVVFTVLDDGRVNVNGTPSQEYIFSYQIPSTLSGDYYFSGCPSGGSNNSYDVFMYDRTTSSRPKQWDGITTSVSDFGTTADNQVKIIEGHTTEYRIRVRRGHVFNNVIFSPYLRVSTAPSAYMPYSATGWYHSLKKYDGAAWQNATVHEF